MKIHSMTMNQAEKLLKDTVKDAPLIGSKCHYLLRSSDAARGVGAITLSWIYMEMEGGDPKIEHKRFYRIKGKVPAGNKYYNTWMTLKRTELATIESASVLELVDYLKEQKISINFHDLSPEDASTEAKELESVLEERFFRSKYSWIEVACELTEASLSGDYRHLNHRVESDVEASCLRSPGGGSSTFFTTEAGDPDAKGAAPLSPSVYSSP